ncbi:hypothetical protein BGZ76_001938 [Entomortierella beljakovae]|nr:hypothetical protein BGZ76_001938 [Entomortierella beljakovae]
MVVILSKEPVEKTNQINELPPKYAERSNVVEQIRSAVLPFSKYIHAPEDGYIRFGSRLSLRHVITSGYLQPTKIESTSHPLHYPVQGARIRDPGLDEFWQVLPAITDASDRDDLSGKTIRYGTRVRLCNVTNKQLLHCIKVTSSSTTRCDAVVVNYKDNQPSQGTWIVERLESGLDNWNARDLFILRHEHTNWYLYSCLSTALAEYGVSGSEKKNDLNNIWRAELI